MNIEAQLRKLESHYRTAVSATIAAKANYLAIAGEPSATPPAIERAKNLWQRLDARKRAIAVTRPARGVRNYSLTVRLAPFRILIACARARFAHCKCAYRRNINGCNRHRKAATIRLNVNRPTASANLRCRTCKGSSGNLSAA